jgi:ectoine hydroxylase-related dioxygenase (phytanoyl-CoA dioxygenase family)
MFDESNDTLRDQHQVEEAWYLSTYPQVADDLREGYAKSPVEHFDKMGIYRGYLPNPMASRLDNAAGPPSRFGGMWTDFGNAMDLLRGKHELGLVSDAQAELLQTWIRDGYVILKDALPAALLEPAARDLERAYSGEIPALTFDCVDMPPRLASFLPHHRDVPAKALDLHWLSPATRSAIFAPVIVNFIETVFERRPMATQTLGFWRGSQQGSHQDSAYVSYTLNMHFCASWIAYEDVEPGAGELLYYPGSQKLPDYLYPGEQKNIVDASRLFPQANVSGAIQDHVNALPERARAARMREHTFIAKAGDALIWSADLAHGGKPISNTRTRKSMVTHYAPKEIAPLYFEQSPRNIRDFAGKYAYSTSVY